MAINIFAIMPLNAFAIGGESTVYEKDGYTVTYRIQKHADEFIVYAEKYKTDFLKAFSTYSKYSDDIITLTGKHNSAFLKAINDYPAHADDIFQYAKQRGDYFVERFIQESAKGSQYLDDLLERVSRKGVLNSSTLSTVNSFNIKAANLLEKYGYTVDDFNNLKLKNVSNYSADEIKFMKEFRESIEAPTNTTLMSKVLPYESIVDYTSGKYTTLGGFVTKADDVSMCNDYMDYYNMLRLDYIPAQYFPDSDDALAVIRFYTNETDKITVPYYKSESWGGTCDNDPPFTGNGFTASKNGTVIPEYWCYDNITDTKQYCNIMDGAELYKVTKDGDEVLLAIYDKNEGKFIRLEDIK